MFKSFKCLNQVLFIFFKSFLCFKTEGKQIKVSLKHF